MRRAVRRLRTQGVESIAVVPALLVHRIRPTSSACARSSREEHPGARVSLSHEVMPTAPEFERTTTTLVNAYVGPQHRDAT